MQFHLVATTCIAITLIQGVSATASADMHVTVDAGWGGRVRDGRWIPVFVTASSDKPRNVMLSIDWPTGGLRSMHIEQAFAIDARPRTFPLLVPVRGWAYQNASFTIVDRESGKSLAHFPAEPGTFLADTRNYSVPLGPCVGISGTNTQLETLQTAIGSMTPAFLAPARVPEVAMGFDSLDVLVLNGPSLVAADLGQAGLSETQQRAIVDWVRAGGNLIIWPGDGGFPVHSTLVDVLPASLGERQNLNLTDADEKAIGIPASSKLAAYHLEPRPGAEQSAMLNAGQTAAYARRLGMGRIVLAPFNIAELPIADRRRCVELWRPLLAGMPPMDASLSATQPADERPHRDVDRAERDAATGISDFLGDRPKSANNGFGDIMLVLLGVMVIVGPMDGIALKWMGRPPWTWVTTTGWLALATGAVIVGGQLLSAVKSDFKTLRTIDQIGDVTVGSTDYLSFHSSHTRFNDIKAVNNDEWWQPADVNDVSKLRVVLEDVNFHQTSEGNTPQETKVRAGNLRLFRQDRLAAGAPRIHANLKIELRSGEKVPRHLVGTIANLSNKPLKHLRAAVDRGSGEFELNPQSTSTSAPAASVAEIAPMTTMRVDAPIVDTTTPVSDDSDRFDPYQRYANSHEIPKESDLWRIAADVNARRGRQMRALVATGNFAIIYAETDEPAAPATLVIPAKTERHFEFLRALIELH